MLLPVWGLVGKSYRPAISLSYCGGWEYPPGLSPPGVAALYMLVAIAWDTGLRPTVGGNSDAWGGAGMYWIGWFWGFRRQRRAHNIAAIKITATPPIAIPAIGPAPRDVLDLVAGVPLLSDPGVDVLEVWDPVSEGRAVVALAEPPLDIPVRPVSWKFGEEVDRDKIGDVVADNETWTDVATAPTWLACMLWVNVVQPGVWSRTADASWLLGTAWSDCTHKPPVEVLRSELVFLVGLQSPWGNTHHNRLMGLLLPFLAHSKSSHS